MANPTSPEEDTSGRSVLAWAWSKPICAGWLPFSVIPALLSNPPLHVAVQDVQMVLVALSGLTLAESVLFFSFALLVGRARRRRSRTHDFYGRILALKWNVRHLNLQPIAAE